MASRRARFELEQKLQALPARNITVLSLRALDLVAPSKWTNPRDFDAMLRRISGERSRPRLRALRGVAERLWHDEAAGYQRALRIYELVDSADRLVGAASLASKVGERVRLLRFLDRITPKSDTLQAIDLTVKIGAEALAFHAIHDRRAKDTDGVADFGKAMASYASENLLRLSAIVCFDGLVPLGPEFVDRAGDLGQRVRKSDLAQSKVFQRAKEVFPGRSDTARFGAAADAFGQAAGWLGKFTDRYGLSPTVVAQRIGRVVRGADGKLDMLAAFLDVSTNYFEHTGTQTVARELIEDAIAEAPRSLVPKRIPAPPSGEAELRRRQRLEAEQLRLRQAHERNELERRHDEQERRRSEGLWDESNLGAGRGVG